MKALKKNMVRKDVRELEAKFWLMMRAAGPGKRCLK
jgi:hypothetical protein